MVVGGVKCNKELDRGQREASTQLLPPWVDEIPQVSARSGETSRAIWERFCIVGFCE